jgi:hypothetical protein
MSFNQKEQFLVPRGTIWHVMIVATQPVGAPATMGMQIDIPEGERGLLLGGVIGPDNYGAGRAITLQLQHDRAGTPFNTYILAVDTVDNVQIVFPPILTSITETTITANVLGVPYMPFILQEKARLRLTGASLANTETLTMNVFIATRIKPPTTAAEGAAVTLTTNSILQV